LNKKKSAYRSKDTFLWSAKPLSLSSVNKCKRSITGYNSQL